MHIAHNNFQLIKITYFSFLLNDLTVNKNNKKHKATFPAICFALLQDLLLITGLRSKHIPPVFPLSSIIGSLTLVEQSTAALTGVNHSVRTRHILNACQCMSTDE